jgi:ABC-type nitrate/sulfonate/bicarbonate transport system permease component
LLTLMTGISVFVWLSLEENGLWSVLSMGAACALLGALHVHYAHNLWSRLGHSLRFALIGGALGSGTILAATCLMFLKTAAHAHLVPDYSLEQMLSLLARLPTWTAAGILLGAALNLSRSR